MLYEMRTYTAMTGRLPDLNKPFCGNHAGIPQEARHPSRRILDQRVGRGLGPIDLQSGLRQPCRPREEWAAFLAGSERVLKFAETEKNGPVVRRVTAQILWATAYSPMQ